MRRLAWVALVAGSAYALIWGVSWMAGDRSTVFFGLADGATFSTYPGVLLGGLPPTPIMDTDLPQLLAAIVGLAGIALLAAMTFRGRRA